MRYDRRMSGASKTPATAETPIALGDAPFEVIGGELVRSSVTSDPKMP